VPETLDELQKTPRHSPDPANNIYGQVYRGFKGAGQNMFVFPSIFLAMGGRWLDDSGKPSVNTRRA